MNLTCNKNLNAKSYLVVSEWLFSHWAFFLNWMLTITSDKSYGRGPEDQIGCWSFKEQINWRRDVILDPKRIFFCHFWCQFHQLFMRADPKSPKKDRRLDCIFYAFRIWACKTLVKLTSYVICFPKRNICLFQTSFNRSKLLVAFI